MIEDGFRLGCSFDAAYVRRGCLRRVKPQDAVYLVEILWTSQVDPSDTWPEVGGLFLSERQKASEVFTLKRAELLSGNHLMTSFVEDIENHSRVPDVESLELFLTPRLCRSGCESDVLVLNENWHRPLEVEPWASRIGWFGGLARGVIDERIVPELQCDWRLLPMLFDGKLVNV
jgi:hypothetical protein